jgi:hypothetical protein
MHVLYSVYYELTASTCFERGPGSSVGIATGYRLDGSGIESSVLVEQFTSYFVIRHGISVRKNCL